MTDVESQRRKAICEIAGVDDIGDLSDGFHTFNSLYEQRMILFAALVKAYKDKAWKSYRHEDGEYCFGGGWFIVGIDTSEGSYTYHYENKYFDLFDCEELACAKHWDGHTEKDVTRLLSLPSVQPVARDIDVLSNDLISRQAAIDALRMDISIIPFAKAREYVRAAIETIYNRLEALPSAQPEPCEDAVSKEAVSKWLKQYGQDVLHGKYKFSLMYIWKNLMDLPSVTPKAEQRWIPCSESLPDREMHVWVSMCDDDVLRAIWRNGWCAPNGYKLGLTDGQVIAWMPRQIEPEPYREEGEQDDQRRSNQTL